MFQGNRHLWIELGGDNKACALFQRCPRVDPYVRSTIEDYVTGFDLSHRTVVDLSRLLVEHLVKRWQVPLRNPKISKRPVDFDKLA